MLSIPELAISPLASRVVQVFQNLNFKDFVRLLAAFSDRASREDKLQFMFRVYDVDRDGQGVVVMSTRTWFVFCFFSRSTRDLRGRFNCEKLKGGRGDSRRVNC